MYVHVPDGLGRLPGVRRHRRSARRSTCSRRSTRSGSTASPARAPRSASSFMALTLVTGSLWGRLTWGVFWHGTPASPRPPCCSSATSATSPCARLGGSHQQRAKRSAVVGLLAVLEIPLVHWSVRLWRSLHQEATVLDTDGDIDMDGLMLFSLFVGVVAFTLLYVWLVLHRTRAMAMEDLLDDQGLDVALADAARRGGGRMTGQCWRWTTPGSSSAATSSRSPSVGALAWRFVRHGRQLRRAGRRRRQVLDLTDDRPLASHRARRRAAPAARTRRRWFSLVVLGSVLVGGRRDRHPVPAVGGRLLLQRRRGRRPVGLRRRPPPAGAGRRRRRLDRRAVGR